MIVSSQSRGIFFLSILVFSVFFVLLSFSSFAGEHSAASKLNLMPIPETVELGSGQFRVTDAFTAAVEPVSPGKASTLRAEKALRRTLNRLTGRTGIFFKEQGIHVGTGSAAALKITFKRTGKLKLGEDESYKLDISENGMVISAETDIGVMRGLETFLQLLNADEKGYFFPAVTIKDKPRFPWRGLMLDPCRHWMPVDVIKRNIDGMAAVKLNVLHWHLSEDQGFRVECKTFPKLHRMGSDGLYYTQAQIKDVIAYAADRGIRVMPEFDIPGHSTSWLVGYPELGSAPGPYSIERKYGVMDPCFNPANKKVYKFFNAFFKEMCALFPDDYMHIGGDEVNGKHWNANKKIQAFIKKKNLKDNHGLQAYFNKKILKILTKYKKKMVGWDEIFQEGLPKTIVIHSWRGKEAMRKAAQKGYTSLLSNGYYIDLVQPTDFHYLNDPIPADSDLTEAEKERILGGEATMWAELITPETIDSRIWPRTAAIAERLWSPGSVKNVEDMYRRMDITGLQLEELGLNHIKNQAMMLRRLTRGKDIAPLKVLVDVMEPLKVYNRHRQGDTYTFFTPYTRLVDAALPDSKKARLFGLKVKKFLESKEKKSAAEALLPDLTAWELNHDKLALIIAHAPILKEMEPASLLLSKMSVLARETIGFHLSGKKPGTPWLENAAKILSEADKPYGHGELMIVDHIRALIKPLDEKGLTAKITKDAKKETH